MNPASVLTALRALLVDSLDHDMPDLDRAITAIDNSVPNPNASALCEEPVRALLASVVLDKSSPTWAVADVIQSTGHLLHWRTSYQTYTEDDIRALHAGYFVATLVAPVHSELALMHSDTASLYITLQAPNLFYPSNIHKAPELYCVFAGTGEWQKGDRPFEARAPGTWIEHPTGTRHAMNSLDETMMSLAIWTADLDSVPVIVRD